MAASKLKFNRVITDKLNIKGILSEDGEFITYENADGVEQDISLADLLNAFKNNAIEMTICLKSDEDLDIIPADE
jgi:hypothetical protein|nr:MAG TPA: YonK protein [Caudoviricetes sp.]